MRVSLSSHTGSGRSWGCAQGPANPHAAQAERLHALEGKCGKLEEDYRAVAGARDQFRKRVAALEEERGKLQQEQPIGA